MKKLAGDQDRIRQNLYSYIDAFSSAVHDIFERFDFHAQVEPRESQPAVLATEKFARIDLWRFRFTKSQRQRRKQNARRRVGSGGAHKARSAVKDWLLSLRHVAVAPIGAGLAIDACTRPKVAGSSPLGAHPHWPDPRSDMALDGHPVRCGTATRNAAVDAI